MHILGGVSMKNIPIIDLEKTGQNIKKLRSQANMSVSVLQRKMGFMHPTIIYQWEKGTKLPCLDNLVILAEILGVTMDEIIVCRRCNYEGR